MARFMDWFNRTAPGGDEPLPALTRAGIAHLYFESIHPFEDGNGRIGRAISEKALAQALGRPTLMALAATILLRRKDYYRVLEAANKKNELHSWPPTDPPRAQISGRLARCRTIGAPSGRIAGRSGRRVS